MLFTIPPGRRTWTWDFVNSLTAPMVERQRDDKSAENANSSKKKYLLCHHGRWGETRILPYLS